MFILHVYCYRDVCFVMKLNVKPKYYMIVYNDVVCCRVMHHWLSGRPIRCSLTQPWRASSPPHTRSASGMPTVLL